MKIRNYSDLRFLAKAKKSVREYCKRVEDEMRLENSSPEENLEYLQRRVGRSMLIFNLTEECLRPITGFLGTKYVPFSREEIQDFIQLK